jgi:hypothetical protein
MIDTICLLIPKEKLEILDPASWDVLSKSNQYCKYVKNPTKSNIESGLYFPRLTGHKRGRFGKIEANLRIELSLPKLLYFNNLDELEDKDFSAVIDTLRERLLAMGVVAEYSVLQNASVSSVHFSKNIQLENGYTTNYLISEMKKINLRKSFDFASVRYINDGQSICAHTNVHEFIIYDKIADLNKSKSRAIDKDQTFVQRNLFGEIKRNDKMIEVLRFEIRLIKKRKMNEVLQRLGYKKNPTFKDVFNSEMSKKVVNHYWETLIKGRNLALFSLPLSIKDVLRTSLRGDTAMKPKQAIYLAGLFMLGRDENGVNELRSIITKKATDRSWYRYAEELQNIGKLVTENSVRDWVTNIDQALQDYKPYKSKKYENEQK